MQKRDILINLRVSQEEKRIIERKAKQCGMSLSAYLRSVGLGKDVTVAPPPELETIYKQATNFGNSRFANLALKALQHYGGDDIGDNKDMDN
jgi:hypothetical protein